MRDVSHSGPSLPWVDCTLINVPLYGTDQDLGAGPSSVSLELPTIYESLGCM